MNNVAPVTGALVYPTETAPNTAGAETTLWTWRRLAMYTTGLNVQVGYGKRCIHA